MNGVLLKILLLQLMILSACASFEMSTLEFKDVMHFSLSEDRVGDSLKLRICGLSGASALAVKRIDIVTKDNEMIVKPRMVLGREGLSGSFDYTISVSPNIKRVLFGEEGYQIWPVIPPSHPPIKTPWPNEYRGCH